MNAREQRQQLLDEIQDLKAKAEALAERVQLKDRLRESGQLRTDIAGAAIALHHLQIGFLELARATFYEESAS